MNEKGSNSVLGSPMAKNASNKESYGQPLQEIDDVEWLRIAVDRLWSIIDDIDTADDMCKENDICFRNYAINKQKERHKVLVSDGYYLFKPA